MLPTVINLLGGDGWDEARFFRSTVAEIRRALDGWTWRWDRQRERDAWRVRWGLIPHLKKGARVPSIDEILGREKSRQEILKGSAEVMREIGMPENEIDRLLAGRPKERPDAPGLIVRPDGTPAFKGGRRRGQLRLEDA